MQEYTIFNNEHYNKEIIFINSTTDVYYLYNQIFDSLSLKYGEKFSVLIDLFLRNGFSYNRFVNVIFDGKGKYKLFLVNQREIPEDAKKDIRNYLKNNKDILDSSALSQETINFILKY